MLAPACPSDEAQRLDALRALALLDTPPRECFDRITRTARRLFGVPIALVTLVDAERLWFLSRQGFTPTEAPRDVGFCGHTILGDDVFVVPDLAADPRFADNPLVAGEPRFRFYAGHPVRGPEGEKIGTVCVMDHVPRAFSAEDADALRDLAAMAGTEVARSALREAHGHEVAARGMAEAANQQKSAFIAGMSHELRTPLNAILGYAEMLLEDALDAGNDQLAADLRRIHDAGKHLLALVNDVLDVSKLEAGKMETLCEETDLGALVGDVATIVRPLVETNANELHVEVPPDLPVAWLDGMKVKQILFNLLSNAAKFTRDGCVRVSAAMAGDDVVFMVADTGIGMTAEQIGRLFQRFGQGDARITRDYGGTGLGLELSRGLAQLMGGDIGVASRLGGGSTFTLRLPTRARSAAPERASL